MNTIRFLSKSVPMILGKDWDIPNYFSILKMPILMICRVIPMHFIIKVNWLKTLENTLLTLIIKTLHDSNPTRDFLNGMDIVIMY